MIVCINANTFAISEYTLAAKDVVSHNGTVYLVGADAVNTLDDDGDEVVASVVTTGQIEFEASIGKRVPNLTLITGTDSTPTVSIIDDRFVEYPTRIRQGYTDKFTRTYDSPRGVLSTRVGFKVEGPNLNFTAIDVDVVYSADK